MMAKDSWAVRPSTLPQVTLTDYCPDHRWGYEFIKLLSRVMTIAFTSQPPPYAAILDLDRKLRDFYVPAHLRLHWTGQDSSDYPLLIKRWVVLSNKEWGKQLSSNLGTGNLIFLQHC
jgi:hypothetical protein